MDRSWLVIGICVHCLLHYVCIVVCNIWVDLIFVSVECVRLKIWRADMCGLVSMRLQKGLCVGFICDNVTSVLSILRILEANLNKMNLRCNSDSISPLRAYRFVPGVVRNVSSASRSGVWCIGLRDFSDLFTFSRWNSRKTKV